MFFLSNYLSTSYVLGIVLGNGDSAVSKTAPQNPSSWSDILLGETTIV